MHDYEQNCKNLYNDIDNAWPDKSTWYDYTRSKISDFLIQHLKRITTWEDKILNAGSGGTTYDIKGYYYHVDVANKRIENLKNSFVASIENMPFESETFDFVICVGSVINYCNAFSAISEISRVIKNEGIFVLEYERSCTGELLLKKGYNRKSCVQIYTYNNQSNHKLWLYSDKYIDSILEEFNFEIDKHSIEYFHCISAIVNRLKNNEEISGKYSIYDNKCPSIIKPKIAHNRIMLCRKSSLF